MSHKRKITLVRATLDSSIFTNNLTTADNNESEKRELMFGYLIRNVYEDAQGRLVFRAQMFIHNDIQNYQPKPEDFELRVPCGWY